MVLLFSCAVVLDFFAAKEFVRIWQQFLHFGIFQWILSLDDNIDFFDHIFCKLLWCDSFFFDSLNDFHARLTPFCGYFRFPSFLCPLWRYKQQTFITIVFTLFIIAVTAALTRS